MTESQFYDVLREGLMAALVTAMPILTVALVVGLTIGLVQALTSIQEMTLTFVPKLGAIVITFWVTMNFMTRTLVSFFQSTLVPMIAGV